MPWPRATLSRPARAGLPCSRASSAWLLTACLFFLLSVIQPVGAVFIDFDNCLDPNIQHVKPLQLQFVPLFFDAVFDTHNPSHNLNITIYGNVSGQATTGDYPPADSPDWANDNITFGKIVDVSPTNDKYSTLFNRYQVLTYDAYDAPATEFCNSTLNDTCPLSPSFNGNVSDPYSLSAFTVAHDFYSSYAFATFAATIRVQSGDKGAPDLACISASITPDLGTTLAGLLTFLPAAVLIFVAIATAAAAIYSPWGTSDPFKWTTNYGRDEDLLRLVTPGFGDCLQYIQFIFLTGALTLNYPGYYQPATSQASWAALQFNESFVSHGSGKQSLIDGVYNTNGTYGLTRMSQLVGMTAVRDIWACLAIWLVVLSAIAVALCQFAFLMRWMYRQVTNTTEQDLRRKNWPLTAGMIVRLVYNYFLLPAVSLSMFQLVVAPRSPTSVVVIAVILLLAIIVFAGWILRVIFRTKPRALLFDDLPTVLTYGSLYNTYSDEAAPFALVPAVLTFMRGVAIGAVQPSGIAQLIILAICEVILILTLHAFRPFHSPTSMNAYHTFFAVMRLIATLLMIAFIPSLGVTEAPKGWIGYAILLLHAIVLIFGFFMNAVQTLIEVGARLAGAGGDPQHGAARGALISYSWRQLAKRTPDRSRRVGSMTSDAAILANDSDAKSLQLMGRSRSLSASSQALLNQHLQSDRVSGFEAFSSAGDYPSTPGADTSGGTSPFGTLTSTNGKRPILGLKTEQPLSDPYYRPPRQRRQTNPLDPYTPGAQSRPSAGAESEWEGRPFDDSPEPLPGLANDSGEGPSFSDRDAPSPAYLRHNRGNSDPEIQDPSGRPVTDYAVREVDFYYGVRGPALSNTPARKLKTGPADPMGPVSSAATWFQRIAGGKSKDKGKGFEVVRSSRAPPPGMAPQQQPRQLDFEEGQELQTSPPMAYQPYHDLPDAQAGAGATMPRGFRSGSGSAARMQLDGPWDNDDESELHVSRTRTGSSPPPPSFLRPIDRMPSLSMQALGEPASDGRDHVAPSRSSRRMRSQDVGDYMPPGALRGDHQRPTSMGRVQRGMAGDSMFESGIGEGSSAEFVHSGRTLSID